jgi:predicted oxidoreductase
VERILRERDLQVDNEFGKDFQIMAIRRRGLPGDRMT